MRIKYLKCMVLLMVSSFIFVGCSDVSKNETAACVVGEKKAVVSKDVKKEVNLENNKKTNVNESINNHNNLNNFGLACKSGEWIYYLQQQDDDGKLYKKKEDGSSVTKLCDDYAFYINVVGDYVYYNNASDGNKIYRIKNDGSEKTKLSDDVVEEIYVDKNIIYYIKSEDCKMYKLYIDTKKSEKVSDDMIQLGGIDLDDEWIYYINEGIYKMKKDGAEKKLVLAQESYIFNLIGVDNEYIYYLTDMGIYKIKKDGNLNEKVYEGNASWGNLQGDKIFFSDINNGCIYVVDKNGKNLKKLVEDFAYRINVVGNLIYYDYSNRPIKLKWKKLN